MPRLPTASHPLGWFITILVGNALSLACSIWLFWKLQHLAGRLRDRLFVRQLSLLTGVDILFHVSFAFSSTQTDGPVWVTQRMFMGCELSSVTFSTVRLISVLVEMHIAVSFLLQALHWGKRGRRHRILKWCLPLTWIVGIFIGGPLEIFFGRWHWDSVGMLCISGTEEHTMGQDWTTIVSLITCGTVCLISYVVVLGRSMIVEVPGSVQRRYLHKAAWYPLNFLITYLLMIIAYANLAIMEDQDWKFKLASAFESLSGFLNVLTYAMQSRYATAIRATPSDSSSFDAHIPRNQTSSWNVQIGEPEVYLIPTLLCAFDDNDDEGLFFSCVSNHSSVSSASFLPGWTCPEPPQMLQVPSEIRANIPRLPTPMPTPMPTTPQMRQMHTPQMPKSPLHAQMPQMPTEFVAVN